MHATVEQGVLGCCVEVEVGERDAHRVDEDRGGRTPRRLARELGVTRVDFYHYGFVHLGALDWIRAAIEA